MSLHVLVIGAGAWGLPTATRIAEKGHRVTLLDRWGPGNALSSSPGPSRIWRLADHRPERVLLSVYAKEALQRSAEAAGQKLFSNSGMLWRHADSNDLVASALASVGAKFERVAAAGVERFFPGLKESAADAVWTPDAGTLFADRVIATELQRFNKAVKNQTVNDARGRKLLVGAEVTQINPGDSPSVSLRDGTELVADVIVVAAGMGAKELLDPLLASPLPFVTRLEQVVHFGDPKNSSLTDDLPCIFDGATNNSPGMYGMATPGVGYKFGLDTPIRDFDVRDLDRTPSATRTAQMRDRVAKDFAIPTTVIDEQVCNWTDSADGDFVLDRLPGNIVVGVGDSGEGFKFTSLIGETLTALALNEKPVIDLQAFSATRFSKNPALKPDTSGASLSYRRFGE